MKTKLTKFAIIAMTALVVILGANTLTETLINKSSDFGKYLGRQGNLYAILNGNLAMPSYNLNVIRADAKEPEPTMQEWVKMEIEKAGLSWEEAECIIINESHWENTCNANTNLSTDCGIWRINSVHKDTISFADRLDYKKATEWAINKRLTVGHWNDWVAYKNNCK